jgi:hypothetical protein
MNRPSIQSIAIHRLTITAARERWDGCEREGGDGEKEREQRREGAARSGGGAMRGAGLLQDALSSALMRTRTRAALSSALMRMRGAMRTRDALSSALMHMRGAMEQGAQGCANTRQEMADGAMLRRDMLGLAMLLLIALSRILLLQALHSCTNLSTKVQRSSARLSRIFLMIIHFSGILPLYAKLGNTITILHTLGWVLLLQAALRLATLLLATLGRILLLRALHSCTNLPTKVQRSSARLSRIFLMIIHSIKIILIHDTLSRVLLPEIFPLHIIGIIWRMISLCTRHTISISIRRMPVTSAIPSPEHIPNASHIFSSSFRIKFHLQASRSRPLSPVHNYLAIICLAVIYLVLSCHVLIYFALIYLPFPSCYLFPVFFTIVLFYLAFFYLAFFSIVFFPP